MERCQMHGLTARFGRDSSEVLPFVVGDDKSRRSASLGRYWRSMPRLVRSLVLIGLVGTIIVIGGSYSLSGSDATRPDAAHAEIQARIDNRNEIVDEKEALVRQEEEAEAEKNRVPPPVADAGNAVEEGGHAVPQVRPPKDNGGPPVFTGPTNDRQRAVVEAFKHAWKGYRTSAWGHDQLKPISKTYSDWFDTGLTIVDSIDTAIVMGLKEEVAQATTWIRDTLSFEKDRYVNFFEASIRVVGGLLSAYHLTGDQVFADKAEDVGSRLIGAWTHSKSAVPLSDVNLRTRSAKSPQWSSDSSLSEATTVQLEYRDLARVSGNATYEDLAWKTSEHIHSIGCATHGGLCDMFINTADGRFKPGTTITFGARADSYYEYLLKQYLQTGKKTEWLLTDYSEAMASMERLLLKESKPHGLRFVGELIGGSAFSPKMDHLVCFLAGTLALGKLYAGQPESHLKMAEDIGATCHAMYKTTTGLAPEIAHFNMEEGDTDDVIIKPLDSHCLLRPEAVEAWFYLYRATGDKKYQEWGWDAFQAIEKHARIAEGGYSSVNNVKATKVQYRDLMESFFLAETLKYLYLLLGDDQSLIPLDRWVFNTEGHPLPIRDH